MSDVRRFLEELFRDAPADSCITITCPVPEEVNAEGDVPMLSEHAEGVEAAAAAVAEADEADRDVYFGLGARRAGLNQYRRGSGADVIGLGCLWADIDIGSVGHKSKALPPDEDAVAALLEEMPQPPSLLVRSGGGLHAYWLLDDWCADAARVEAACKAWQSILIRAAAAKGYHLDGTGDRTRVLRVPGTRNHKTPPPRPVELLIEDSPPRYALADLEAACAAAGSPPGKPKAAVAYGELGEADPAMPRLERAVLFEKLLAVGNDKRDAVQRVLAGEPFAPDGDLDTTMNALTGVIAFMSPGYSPDDVAEVLRPSLEAIASRSGASISIDAELDKAREKASRALSRSRTEWRAKEKVRKAFAKKGGEEPEDDLPTIKIDRKHHIVAEEVIAAIGQHPATYQLGRKLVEVLHAPAVERTKEHVVWRPSSTPQIYPISPSRLDIVMSESFDMEKYSAKEKTYIPTNNPPDWLAGAILARRAEWPNLRELRAVGDAPAILPDGMIVHRRGYHAASGLYLASDFDLDVPDRPTRRQAIAAAKALLDLVSQFPFVDDNHRVAWLAALLTPLAKFAFDGNAPFMLFEAAAASSGKTLLVELVAQIAFGQSIARTPWSDDDSEIRKKITTCIADGDRMVLFDNVANGSVIKSAALDAVLTGPVWKDRRLGANESICAPSEVVWFASGNNLSVGGDLERRTIYCRLESTEDDPGRRANFKGFKYDLDRYPQIHRAELLSHALTVLRAFIQEGCPVQSVDGEPLAPMASFEAWSRLVRGSVAWVTGLDPLATREQLQAVADRGRSAAQVLVGELTSTFGFDNTFTAKDVANEMYAPFMSKKALNENLKDAVEELCNVRPGQRASPAQIGHQLRKLRGRRFGGAAVMLDTAGDGHAAGKWKVISSATQ